MAKPKPKQKPRKREADRHTAASGVWVGRQTETAQIRACFDASKNLLLEGPVGVGKTHLALALAQATGKPVFRVDGDSRYTEQKLSGWFDPPLAIRHGFGPKSFIPGPLVSAMQTGGILFINELNRLPEGVQNVLLPAIDERLLVIPRLGTIAAKPGFLVIATQNPKEFVATSHLSEAILDRFEWVYLDYQSQEEERAIVSGKLLASPQSERLARLAVAVARYTRNHERVKRGASVRAAISVAELSLALLRQDPTMALESAFLNAVWLALPTRIELERDSDTGAQVGNPEWKQLSEEWVQRALASDGDASVASGGQKKNFS